ncbi:MAG: S49 family peptidase [Alphaproteobacteria bacterium]|nr:MAG: S49 family peptidase [Alphaproteobacteria bacterium]
MNDLPHIAARVFGAPLMLARPKLDVLLSVLGPRLTGACGETLALGGENAPSDDEDLQITAEGVAVVPVLGTLVTRSSYLAALSGLTSYAVVGQNIERAFADPSARAVLLEIDSPGGEVGGLFDLCDKIAALKAQYGKPLWALAHEGALSAAYAIASCADKIVLTQTAEVGSIGVVAVHVDESGADEQAGLAWNFIYAGERKVDGNPHEPLADRAREEIQADVDGLYAAFVALVSKNRGLQAETVRGTEAGVYRGASALDVRLADAVMSRETALAALGSSITLTFSQFSTNRKDKLMNAESKKIEAQTQVETPQPEQPPAAPAADPAPTPPQPAAEPAPETADQTAIEAKVTQKVRESYAEMAQIAAQAARLGVTLDVAEAMAKGLKPDAMRRAVLDELAARSDATGVVAAATAPTATSVDSPIVRRARAAAEKSKA